MKLSVAIAGTNALASTFVVFRGFEKSIMKAASLGYDGVELALKCAGEVDKGLLSKWLTASDMEVSCISTGQVFADLGLMFTDANPQKRSEVCRIFKDLIDLAADFGRMVNIGRVRGRIGPQNPQEAERLFIEMARELCSYAATKTVTLVLEPVNRYELDFINSIEDGVKLLNKVDMPNMKLMPDIFHMNIEDRAIGPELARHIDNIAYIHFADSNRLAPGQGHIDFKNIIACLRQAKYDGWVSVEILPRPDPDTAASQAIEFLRPLINKSKRRQK